MGSFVQEKLILVENKLESWAGFTKLICSGANNLKDAARDEKVDTSKPLEDVMKNISTASSRIFWKSSGLMPLKK